MSNLILDSLEIRNFRGLRELRIEHLGRVNLIVGKNNVGKTSVLEALRLYAQPGSPDVVLNLLRTRDELFSVRKRDEFFLVRAGRTLAMGWSFPSPNSFTDAIRS